MQEVLVNEITVSKPATLLKKRHQHMCFRENFQNSFFEKYLKATISVANCTVNRHLQCIIKVSKANVENVIDYETFKKSKKAIA